MKDVGCDGYLGSLMREDNCRVCGGRNENCNTINGIFNESNLQVGYNDILLIPAGATNILVREEGKGSNNYLGKYFSPEGGYFLICVMQIVFKIMLPNFQQYVIVLVIFI